MDSYNEIISILTESRNSMDEIADKYSDKDIVEIIEEIKKLKIDGIYGNYQQMKEAILANRKVANNRFINQLDDKIFYMLNKEDKSIDEVLIEIRKSILSINNSGLYSFFSEEANKNLVDYLISKNRSNKSFEKNYIRLTDMLKFYMKRQDEKYKSKLITETSNIVLPQISKLKEKKQEQLPGNIFSDYLRELSPEIINRINNEVSVSERETLPGNVIK